jgi:hypothetical protein
MAVELILSTDKLQSGFRAKYNASANEIITAVADNGDGTATLTKKSTGTFTLNLTTSFFTKAQVTALISALVSPFTYFTDNSQTGIVCDKTAGTVTLADIETDFPTIFANGIIRLNVDILIGGSWISNDVLPSDIVKNVDGEIESCVFYLGNTGITTIEGRIF